MQRQTAGCIAGHRLEKIRSYRVVDITYTGSHPVTLVQKSPDNPTADESGSTGDGNGPALGIGGMVIPLARNRCGCFSEA